MGLVIPPQASRDEGGEVEFSTTAGADAPAVVASFFIAYMLSSQTARVLVLHRDIDYLIAPFLIFATRCQNQQFVDGFP